MPPTRATRGALARLACALRPHHDHAMRLAFALTRVDVQLRFPELPELRLLFSEPLCEPLCELLLDTLPLDELACCE